MIEIYYKHIEGKFYTFKALFLGIIVIFLTSILYVFKDDFFIKNTLCKIIFIILVLVSYFIYWLWNKFLIPKNKKNKIGIVICINTNDEKAEKDFKEDFVDTLKDTIKNRLLNDLNVVKIPNHLAMEYKTKDEVYKLFKKTNGHIILFGDVKRKTDGVMKYFIDWDLLVRHNPIPTQTSNALSQEFSTIFKNSLEFIEKEAYKNFLSSKDMSFNTIQYMLGVASIFSKDFKFAIDIHEELYDSLKNKNDKNKEETNVYNNLKLWLAFEYLCGAYYYFLKKDKDNIIKFLNISLNYNNQNINPSLWVMWSNYDFLYDDNVKESIKKLKKLKNGNDQVFLFNLTFLYFWKGDYNNALKFCEKIKRKVSKEFYLETSKHVTSYREKYLSNKVVPISIYLWEGFNYYFIQDNLPLALNKIESFLKEYNVEDYVKKKAELWLSEIKKEMRIK